jgi:antitoxin (DNA-binding transcriptional repressor) of toxin-antitoxin stability system
MAQVITVTEMARSFSDIIARVYHKGEEFDIKKGANIVAHISAPKPANQRVVAQKGSGWDKDTEVEFLQRVEAIKAESRNKPPKKPMTFGEIIKYMQSRPSRLSEEECDEFEDRIKENRRAIQWREGSVWD